MFTCLITLIFKDYAVEEEKELKHYGDSLERLRETAKKRRQEEDKAAVKKKKKAEDLASKKVAITRYRNGLDLMKMPLFSVKNPRNGRQFEPFEYVSTDGLTTVKVSPHSDFGMADQIDANIIRLAISKAREIKRITKYTPEFVEFTRYELLKELGKEDNSQNYKWLEGALNRLTSAHYLGKIFNGQLKFRETLISAYESEEKDGTSKIGIKFNLILRAYIDDQKSLLAIDKSILKAKSNLHIRLYEIVQSHMGSKEEWTVGLSKLKNLCGSSRLLKHFKTDVVNSKIPYKISFYKNSQNELMVIFERADFIDKN